MSTTLIFALCIISVCARYYIRLAVQKEFGLDDAILAFGTACLVAAMAILYVNIDNIYLTKAMIYAPTRFAFQPQDLNRSFEFRKMVTASQILA